MPLRSSQVSLRSPSLVNRDRCAFHSSAWGAPCLDEVGQAEDGAGQVAVTAENSRRRGVPGCRPHLSEKALKAF